VGGLCVRIGKSKIVLYHTQCGMAENALKGKNIAAIAQILNSKSMPKAVWVNIENASTLA
jgi:hypothetical protein